MENNILSDTFQSPYNQYKEFIGMKFTVLGKVSPELHDESENGPMYNIRLENGKEIEAWSEEIFSNLFTWKNNVSWKM